MSRRVVLKAVSDYDPELIGRAVYDLLDPLGGMTAFVRPGQRVLIKPNLLSAKPPEAAVTTHPELVRAVIREVRRAGGVPLVGDSPGLGTTLQAARASGILEVAEAEGANLLPFTESLGVRQDGKTTFRRLELAREVVEADVVLNLPKLKTHQMMGLTCAVKNLFGTVVGLRKVRLHLQAGTDKAFFALMLLEIAERVGPALTIVDAVTAMEGNGPGSGDPVQVGALLAGTNLLAVDAAAIALVGMRPEAVWTQREAMRLGRPGCRLEEIELLGDPLEELRALGFRPAPETDVNFGLPAFLRRPLRSALTARPVVLEEHCRRCGHCVSHCPPEAMTLESGQLKIDHALCIRCFCCQELCPYGALEARQGLLLRLRQLLGIGALNS